MGSCTGCCGASITNPNDLVQVLPMFAYHWSEIESVLLPAQPRCEALHPMDLMATRWELCEEIRHVPVMAAGRATATVILPWSLSMDMARYLLEDHTPPSQHWQLSAVSSDISVIHQVLLPEQVRKDLEELDMLRERQRGGIRRGAKVPLEVCVQSTGQTQAWKVDTDTTIECFINALALDMDAPEENVLLMKGEHIPCIDEVIPPYLPIVKLYPLDDENENVDLSIDAIAAGKIGKKGHLPRSCVELLDTWHPPSDRPPSCHLDLPYQVPS